MTPSVKQEGELYSLKLLKDRIVSPIYESRSICIVNSTNAITCKDFGFNKILTTTYPYCHVAGLRYSDDKTGTALKESRGREGSLEFNFLRKEFNSPYIATLITQYGIGLPFEENEIAQKCFRYTMDSDHARRLRCDTSNDRIKYFEDCLLKLTCELVREENECIKYVFLPAGIGRGGRLDTVWFNYYLPIIKHMSNILNKNKKQVCLAISDNYENTVLKNNEAVKFIDILNKIPLIQREDVLKNIVTEKKDEDVCGANRECNIIC